MSCYQVLFYGNGERMDKNLIIGLSIVFILFIIQVVLVIYNRHIVEEIHSNKLQNIKEIKSKFYKKNRK